MSAVPLSVSSRGRYINNSTQQSVYETKYVESLQKKNRLILINSTFGVLWELEWTVGMPEFLFPYPAVAIPMNELKMAMKSIDPLVYDFINDRSMLGFVREDPGIFTTVITAAVVFWSGLGTSIALFSTVGCYKFLRDNRTLLSDRTRVLYFTLANVLVIETSIVFFLGIVPLAVLIWAYHAEFKYGSFICLIIERTISIYPLSSNVILMCVVRPYRRAIVNLWRRIFRSGKLMSTSNPTTVMFKNRRTIQSVTSYK
ncbi:serpentine type 7TM GPCR chemoreceptor srh domain-containing protein [Ditylenchus destructor]|uniref:Serpentine type 7TM GPCR chemoreceptor srh domain-containing protein n=1 Tax=Ditylenchus destructor TaxID=166010 RepID=A0AAD4MKN1_9BILA|nr:serpentine type 7TM GPCR chemoreceptor srh domain-containing protein [Ditylenchus destructor]